MEMEQGEGLEQGKEQREKGCQEHRAWVTSWPRTS